jgi:predicted nucleotidyltransferase
MQPGETPYAFLDRVDDPWFDSVRQVIDEWVKAVPAGAERDRLIHDLRRDGISWTAALWELFLYTVLAPSGRSVLIHPMLKDSLKRPDFLVETEAGSFYVEATVSRHADAMEGTERRLRDFIQGMRWLNDHDVIPDVFVRSIGTSSLSAKKLRPQLEDAIAGLLPGQYGRVAARVQERGWDVQVSLSRSSAPLPRDVFTRSVSRVGIETLEERMLKPLRKALKEKGAIAARLDRPAFIAVLLSDSRPVPEHFLDQVLFGRELHRIAPDGTGNVVEVGIERRHDGFFGSHDAPRYRNVLGVVVGQDFGEHNLAAPTIRTKLNPWAQQIAVEWPWDVHEYDPITLEPAVREPTRELSAFIGVPADRFEADRPFERWNFDRAGLSRREWAERIAERVKDSIAPSRIVLFGSVARGDDGAESDVDILVVVATLRPEDKAKLISTLRAATADIPVTKDFVVADERELAESGDVVGSAVYWPVNEGIVLYDRAA